MKILSIITLLLSLTTGLIAQDKSKAPRLPIGSDAIPFNLPGVELKDRHSSKII